ncbi:TldD/PmbA family protein [Bradymonadaceae bacterium TMQ3]|uniref:TldD/PmbA family protein n=1 Tax=Lujinxingia sediminis TaxID=2480984 RepID=A0ABY0CR05_9DELT|nr:TldD/PmbA family protein [Lujinxingia sediminis]RDV36963.1 TldD/PmbA family protein [Bradymonadaceae bacterium TMQ3]RVU42956.1 TldD/PmbA family protein [Lujinxingia sediminis]TXC73086.1 TldD/PmbA family protein [Bradymonadales bacterium TMQ1]
MSAGLMGRVSGRLLAGMMVAMVGCAAAPTASEPATVVLTGPNGSEREEVVSTLSAELDRSMERLRLDDYEGPYFLSYQLKDDESVTIGGKFGALTTDSHSRQRYAYVESRVGSYGFDNFANIDAESYRMANFRADRVVPLDDGDALRGALWLLTDETYKKALSDYLTKRGGAVYEAQEEVEVPSFSREDAVSHRGPAKPLELDEVAWREQVRRITGELKEHTFLLDASMEVSAQRVVRYLVNSEGSEVVDEQRLYTIQAQAYTRADDGMLLENSRLFYARDLHALPSWEVVESAVAEMIEELRLLREAEVIDPYTGPAILAPEATGVLFHEAVGHRLEGERQRDEQEGRTFQGRVGKVVLPEFISVYDDPLLSEVDGVQLNGYYTHDDEGVPAQRAELIEEGVLRGFLMSRTPIEGVDSSNGHGRAQGVNVPRARMANLVVEATEEAQVSFEELRQRLLDEVRRQGKPFGLLIQDITGGSTNTLGYGYQAFKGVPRMIYRIDAETGEQELVRGVELVGTPLSSINKIVAASQETGIFNGYCGAESGYVPVSTVAPAILTTEIELQRTQQARERRPILSPPWAP